MRAEHGDAWMAANADSVRYPGYRRLHAGSGLLVDDDGFVLTADHLLRDEKHEVAPLTDVEFADGSFAATAVVGTEPTVDLSVLRVADPARLPSPPPAPLEMADTERLEAGHWLIALGDPPGPGRTFRVGVVAAPPVRQCYQEQLTATGLQSSLEVPPGELGGPVVDILGQVVGLSVRPTGVSDRFAVVDTGNFTLPINLVLTLYEALKVAQSRRSPWLGISVLELPAAQRKGADPLPPSGVYIDDVFDPSPASRAGVHPGDVLTAMSGHPITAVSDFQTWLYVLGIGTRADLRLVRAGAAVEVSAPIEERPASARPQ